VGVDVAGVVGQRVAVQRRRVGGDAVAAAQEVGPAEVRLQVGAALAAGGRGLTPCA